YSRDLSGRRVPRTKAFWPGEETALRKHAAGASFTTARRRDAGRASRQATLQNTRPRGGQFSLRRIQRVLRVVARSGHDLFVRVFQIARRQSGNRASSKAGSHLPKTAASSRGKTAGYRLRLGRTHHARGASLWSASGWNHLERATVGACAKTNCGVWAFLPL